MNDNAPAPHIEYIDVRKTYDRSNWVVSDLDLHVQRGNS